MLKRLFQRLWNSPTFTSWSSIGVQIASVTLVLPLILRGFETPEIAVWYLFSTLIGLQLYFEVGFSPTFQRMYAFGMGGATKLQLATIGLNTDACVAGEPDWQTIEAIYSTTQTIFFWIATATMFLLASVGTLSLIIPIAACSNPQPVWVAWAVLAVSTSLLVYGKSYRCYINGTNHIALQQRWITFFGVLSTLTNFAVLLLGGGILALVISQQCWGTINVVRDRYLARHILAGRAQQFQSKGVDPVVFDTTWPAAWRSGLGNILCRGTLSASSLLIAQISASGTLATYLLGVSLISKVNEFALAPFYSKLPILAQKRALGDVQALTTLSQRGMFISYATFLLGFASLGILGPSLIHWIGSNAEFPTAAFWTLIGVAFFLERFGAMHLQLYSTTNNIIWHWVTIGYAIIYLLTLVIGLKPLGVNVIPLGMILGYATFFVPISTWYSYRSVKSGFWRFEKTAFLPALALFALFSAILFVLKPFA